MALNNSSKATQAAILDKKTVVVHDYIDWLAGEARKNSDAQFAAVVLDVASGAATIASIVSSHVLDLEALVDGVDSPVLLNKNDMGALSRLAVYSLTQLSQEASRRVEAFNNAADKGARA